MATCEKAFLVVAPRLCNSFHREFSSTPFYHCLSPVTFLFWSSVSSLILVVHILKSFRGGDNISLPLLLPTVSSSITLNRWAHCTTGNDGSNGVSL